MMKLNIYESVTFLIFLICKCETKLSTYISYTPPDIASSTIETTFNSTSIFFCLQACMKENCFQVKYDDVRK